MVVFDSTYLVVLLHPDAGRANDSSGIPIPQLQERIAHLVQRLEKTKIRIVVPTPVLAEILVYAGAAGPKIVETLTRSNVFKVLAFDELAAVEASIMTRAALSQGDKRSGIIATWAKVKFDRQIVAIAKIAQATMIYSDDGDVRALAAIENIPVTSLAELPLPAENRQPELPLGQPPNESPNAARLDGDEEIDEPEDGDEPEDEDTKPSTG